MTDTAENFDDFESTAIAADDAPLRLEATACASLQGLTIPASAIGLPTSGAVVQTAVSVDATYAGPALELPAPFRAGPTGALTRTDRD